MRAAAKDLAELASAHARSDEAIAKSAKQAALALQQKQKAAANLDREIRASPERFSKAASAINLLSSALGPVGGKAAMATTQIANMGALLLTGGPVGLAIAATTALVAGLTWAFAGSGDAADDFADELKKIQDESDLAEKDLGSLRRQLEDFGKESRDASIDRLNAEIKILENQRLHYNVQASMVQIGEDGLEIVDDQTRQIQEQAFEIGQQLELKRQTLQLEYELRTAETWREQDKERARAAEAKAEERRRERERRRKEAERAAAEREEKLARNQLDRWAFGDKLADEAARKDEERRLRDDQLVEQSKQKELDAFRARVDAAQGYGIAFGSILAQMASGQENAGKLALKATVDLVGRQILAHAAESAVAAFKSQAGIPVIGPILGVAAAGAAYAFAMSYMSKFAAGGFVSNGTPGRDDQVALVRRNEYVMSEREVQAAQSRGALPERLGGGRASGGGMTMHAYFGTVAATTSQERKRWLLSMRRDLEDLVRKGHIDLKAG
jgi:hypothetical protein